MQCIKKNPNQSGFTLIELLVVISIIAVLTALLLPNLAGLRERANDTKVKGDLKQLKTALRLYYNDFQEYPGHSGANAMMGCGEDGDELCTGGGVFSAGASSTVYMQALPESFSYAQTDSGEGFEAWSVLQNASDGDIAESASKCGVALPIDNAFYVCSD